MTTGRKIAEAAAAEEAAVAANVARTAGAIDELVKGMEKDARKKVLRRKAGRRRASRPSRARGSGSSTVDAVFRNAGAPPRLPCGCPLDSGCDGYHSIQPPPAPTKRGLFADYNPIPIRQHREDRHAH